MVARFYQCFESIQVLGVAVAGLVEELEGGRFIQQSLDTLLRLPEGRQLLAEAVYLLGVRLLLPPSSSNSSASPPSPPRCCCWRWTPGWLGR